MYTRALLSVFKGRLYDPLGRDGAIDRCEVSVQDRADEAQCRFIIKMVCNQGVIKTYKLTYEAVDVMHALFDRNAATNRWSISAGAMKEYVEFFGTKTELLDIFAGEEERAVFKSYTEKIANGKEILKHPLATAVAVNKSDFQHFTVQEGLHIIISVKDFKAIVTHADTMKTTLNAYYSHPTRPLQFSYGIDGLLCEFTLMTSGDASGATAPPTPVPQNVPSRTATRTSTASTGAAASAAESHSNPTMPPPTRPARRQIGSRPISSPKVAPEEESDNLFVTQHAQEAEDDEWEPTNHENEEDELGWDASADRNTGGFSTFQDSGSFMRPEAAPQGGDSVMEEGIAPTQRVSQIKGLW